MAAVPCYAALLIVTVAALLAGRAAAQAPRLRDPNAPAAAESTSGVYLPSDRTSSRAITRAKERLADREYHEVLAFLQSVLARDEDSFLERGGDDSQQPGLKATARQLIGELPPEGYDAYELLHGANARRQLEAAIQSGDRAALAKVVRQFFHTSAGYEATLVLAEMEADQGHRLAAAELYRELIASPRAAARLEPQLSVAAALNLLAAGQRDDAAAVIRALAQSKPSQSLSIAGKTVPLPAASADPLAWLASFAGQTKVETVANSNWLTLHGDTARSSQASGGRPHLRPRWEARVVNDPTVESFLSGRGDDFIQRGVLALPGARPIAVGDVVIMRTPENIVAIDWQTGKRVWESRDEQELQTEFSNDPTPGFERDQWNNQGKALEERVWDDALMTSLSSDGKRVFVVRGMANARDDEGAANWQVQFLNRNNSENAAATNQLTAYDLASQGKLLWELDGARANGKLAGAFFLGAPLAIDNMLYVMAEIKSALYLVAIDPANGQVQWQQQLLGLEQSIALDPVRRRAGVTPSYAGGVLICPTAASTVVAIDLVKREFAWVYRYPRDAQPAEMRNFWQPQQAQPQFLRTNKEWLDGSAVIADGRVLITPPESPEIYCLDLQTGKLLWHHRQADSLFIGGVDHGNVLLVGSRSVMARRLTDGDPAWKKEASPLPASELPAGQGYVSDGHYYLPLTSGQIAEIDFASGELATFSPAASNLSLGNLISYRGSIISQSPLVIDKFEQLDVLRKRTDAALARNTDDPVAIREAAELKRSDNQKPEAIRLLKRSYELAPNDLVTQDMLVELLLEQLAGDYAAFRSDVPLVSKLIRSRDQQIELLRLDAAGLDDTGARLAAWDAYMRLADFTAEEPAYLRIDDKYVVRSDRWIGGRLAAMWAKASPEERKSIEEKLAARHPNLTNPRTAAELRHYLAHLEQLQGSDDVRLALATYLLDHDRPQEAELELLQSLAYGSEASRPAASALLAKVAAKNAKQSERPAANWPQGHVDAQLITSAQPQANGRPVVIPNQGQMPPYRQLRIEQDFLPQTSSTHWFISNDSGEIIGRNRFGEDVARLSVERQNRDSNFVHGARLGHLLFVTMGNQIISIDKDGEILWPTQSEGVIRDPARPRRGPTGVQARGTRAPLYHAFGRKRLNGASGAALGSLGPVTPRSVVYQDDNELKCVDPLTGVTLWSRTDIPPGCELFGDSEYVFAADVGSKTAYAIRLSDGQLLDKRDRPRSEWLLTAGRNVANLTSAPGRGNRTLLTVTDAWEQKPLYQLELMKESLYTIIEPNLIATLEPTGQFRLVDVLAGKAIIDEKLEPGADAKSLYTLRSGDDLFVFISSPLQAPVRMVAQSFDYPIVNGPVYAFNLQTGKPLWPGPAQVRNRGIQLAQPRELPFLVFGDRAPVRSSPNESTTQLRLLCIDKRTGATVYRNDQLPDSGVARFRTEATDSPRPQVTVEIGTSKVQLTLTDRPRPPQPPMNDDLETVREAVDRGIRGLGAQLGGAFRNAMERGLPTAPNEAPRQDIRPKTDNAKPAKDASPDDDD